MSFCESLESFQLFGTIFNLLILIFIFSDLKKPQIWINMIEQYLISSQLLDLFLLYAQL